MKDIKTLYTTAKNSRNQRDISLYSEAVEELIKDDPKSFILNLEYIITSDMNLSKLDKFVETYGLPIPVCNTIIEHLEKCVDKCNKLSKDSTLFKESLDKYTTFKSDHKNCFNMYEYYIDDPSKEDLYINTYYSSNSSGIQNRKLVAGMINRFGEAVIPDMLIVSNMFGPKAINTLYEFLNGLTKLDSTCYQWITECSNELNNNNVPAYSEIVSKSLQSIVDNKISETRDIIRESVIMGDEDSYIPYTESDVNSIKDLISFTEYKITCTESSNEALTLQNRIYSLYEELDGLIDEDGEQFIDIVESSTSDKNECIKKVSNKLINFAKELGKDLKGTISDIKDEIRQTGDRDEKKLIRFNFVRGRVAIGNKEKPFGILAINSIKAKRDTIKLLRDDLKSNSKYLNELRYHAIIEIETSTKLNDYQKKLFTNIADKIFLNSSIRKYIDDGILSISPCREFYNKDPKKSVFSENNVMNEYVIVTYNYSIYWVVSLSRKYAFDGIDTSIFESINNVGYLLNSIIESTDYTVISENRMSNTNNKYTGEIPAYLANNHNLKYGEDDDKSIEDFKRPSVKAKEDNMEQPESDKLYNYSDLDNKENDDEEEPSSDSHATNNYYYYTYTNSLNKNSNSFNKDSSTHDDHSTHNRKVTDDHSTNKRINSNDYRSNYSDEEEDMSESVYEFIESSNYYMDTDEYDKHIKNIWFIKSDNGVDNCCVSITGYPKPMRGRSILVTLKKEDNKWYALIKKKPNGQWEFPGGGWDRGEKAIDAAIRELHEECQVNVKNVKRLGTQIQFNPNKIAVSPWVKKHVKNSDDWWYGYYSAIFIGEYDGNFTGHIEEEDYEDTFEWKSLTFISKKFSHKFIDSIENYIQSEFNESVSDEYLSESVDVINKKFDKAYKAAFNYENGHLLKITYSLQGCEVTNVGLSKAMRDHIASIAEEVNKENHRGSKFTKNIRAFMVMLKGLSKTKKHIRKRKKIITNFLNEHIGDIGYLDFQAKNCKIIEIFDLYTMKEIKEEVPIVGVYAARHMESAKSKILSDKDLKSVHKILDSGKTKFHVSKHKVGDIEIYPTFMSTYWNDKGDHNLTDLSNKVIDSDQRDKSIDNELDNIPDIIGDLEMKGFHVSDEEVESFLGKYRSTDKWIPDALSIEAKKEKNKVVTEGAGMVVLGGIALGIGVSLIASIISSIKSSINYKNKKAEIEKILSNVAGRDVKYDDLLKDAEKEFTEFLTANESDIIGKFYKADTYDAKISTELSLTCVSSSDKDIEKIPYMNDKRVGIMTFDVITGLIKKSKIESYNKELNEKSNIIDIIISDDEMLNFFPADDDGNAWEYYIRAGIIDGGPEECPDDEDDECFKEYFEEQMRKIKESGYVVASIILGIDGEKFVNRASVTESSILAEAVGDADNMRPQSDHPIKDTMQDIDRSLAKNQQAAKKKVQGVINTANTFVKPVKRTHQWVMKLVNDWKDKNETQIKEKFADPHARKNIFTAITWCIKTGSLAKAGLLLNPIFLFLTITKNISKNDNKQRIRHEMIGELKSELEIIDVKIQDAAKNNHDSDKYKLMRLKNEINKKLLRVGGSDVRSWKKVL